MILRYIDSLFSCRGSFPYIFTVFVAVSSLAQAQLQLPHTTNAQFDVSFRGERVEIQVSGDPAQVSPFFYIVVGVTKEFIEPIIERKEFGYSNGQFQSNVEYLVTEGPQFAYIDVVVFESGQFRHAGEKLATRAGFNGPPDVEAFGSFHAGETVQLAFSRPNQDPSPDYSLCVAVRNVLSGEVQVYPTVFAGTNRGVYTTNSGTMWTARVLPSEPGLYDTWTVESRSRWAAARPCPETSPPSRIEERGILVIDESDVSGGHAPEDCGGYHFEPGESHPICINTNKPAVLVGPGDPETLLSYDGFHGSVPNARNFAAHIADWRTGDPVWNEGKGKGIVGLVNYFADLGMNTMYFLTLNVTGDGDNIWPWRSRNALTQYDARKLAQWRAVLEHMVERGIQPQLLLMEEEVINNEVFGTVRANRLSNTLKFYLREMMARFGDLSGITFTVSEENRWPADVRLAILEYLDSINVYKVPILDHNWTWELETHFVPYIGSPNLWGPSLQIARPSDVFSKVVDFRTDFPMVAFDEIGPANTGIAPDSRNSHLSTRAYNLWAPFLAGAFRASMYLGPSGLSSDSFHPWQRAWEYASTAKYFFEHHFNGFERAVPCQSLIVNLPDDTFCAKTNSTIVVYSKSRHVVPEIRLPSGRWNVSAYDPMTGGGLLQMVDGLPGDQVIPISGTTIPGNAPDYVLHFAKVP